MVFKNPRAIVAKQSFTKLTNFKSRPKLQHVVGDINRGVVSNLSMEGCRYVSSLLAQSLSCPITLFERALRQRGCCKIWVNVSIRSLQKKAKRFGRK